MQTLQSKKLDYLNAFHAKITSVLEKIIIENQRAGYDDDDTEDLEPTFSRLKFISDQLSNPRNKMKIVGNMQDDGVIHLYLDSNSDYLRRSRGAASEWVRDGRRLINLPHAYASLESLIMTFDGMEYNFLNDEFIRIFVTEETSGLRGKQIETLALWTFSFEKKIEKILGINREEQEERLEQESDESEEDVDDTEEDVDGGPKCDDIIMFDELGIKKYLRRNPKNFVIGLVKPSGEIIYECQNLKNFKKQHRMDSTPRDRPPYTQFYECKDETPEHLQGNYRQWLMPNARLFVKMHSYKLMVLKPDWLWDGPVPEPRIFILEQVGDVYKFVTSEAAPTMITDFNAVGKDHCNQKGKIPVFRLTPATLTSDGFAPTTIAVSGGKKKRRTTRFVRKTKKNNKSKTKKDHKNKNKNKNRKTAK